MSNVIRHLLLVIITFVTFASPTLQSRVNAQSATAIVAADLDAQFAVDWMALVYKRIEAEAISAPAGSRLYAYEGITLYEAVLPGIPGNNSLSGQLNAMPDMPEVDSTAGYDWPTVANYALFTVSEGLMSTAKPETHKAFADLRDSQLSDRQANVSTEVIKASRTQGEAVGTAILGWAETDQFKETRDKPFTMVTGDPSDWELTTPGTKPVEPYWGTIRPFKLGSSEDCNVAPNMKFDTDPTSTFYAQAMEVKTTRDNLTEEQKAIAKFWVDTPGITGTPAGHWVLIENQLVSQLHLKLDQAAAMYALVGVALGDAFISCWGLKYQINLIRPETYIKRYIRRSWAPYIQTPPFPEYPSGHSVASAAAAEVLTGLFGTVAFTDDSHKIHNLPARSFTSFQAAANEAAISRLYGGIHFRAGIENGLRQGQCVGQTVTANIQLRPRGNG